MYRGTVHQGLERMGGHVVKSYEAGQVTLIMSLPNVALLLQCSQMQAFPLSKYQKQSLPLV